MENEENVREQLSDYAHETWSEWVKYMFDNAIPYTPGEVQADEGALITPKWAVERWTFQMNTPYEELPEEMKSLDRAEADKILGIVKGSSVCNTNLKED
jgi:hypothetical protein